MKQSNNTRQIATWPTTTLFTFEDCISLNKHIKEATLRFKFTRQIEDKKIVEIGYLTGGLGRPKKVYAFAPITQTILDRATSENINLIDNYIQLFNVVSVSSANAYSTCPTLSNA